MIEADKHDEAKALFAKMEAGQGPKPNIPTYHIMMNLYRKIFDYNSVADLDKKLHESLIARKPNNRIRGVATKNISRPYRPKYRTGSWAMLIALLRNTNDQGLTKQELIDAAQPLCDTSFTEPTDYNGFYSSWSSMTTLRNKNLVDVLRTGDAATTRYSLTEDGKHMAQELDAEERDPSSAVIHAMEAKLNAADGARGAADGANPSTADWFSTELNDRLSSKLQLDSKQIEKVRASVDSAMGATEPARRKQLAAVLLALDAKEGSKAVDGAIKKSKNPGEVAEVAEILRQKNLLSAAK
jgi:hypothetical protein